MTTTVPPPASPVAPERALRILPIRANLLPDEIIDARRSGRIRRTVLVALGAFALLIAIWYVVARFLTGAAEDDLVQAQEDVQRVVRAQNAYSELVEIQGESAAITSQLKALLAQDLRWSKLLDSLRTAAPAGVKLAGISARLSDADQTTVKKPLPNTSGYAVVGEITITGSAPDKVAVSKYVTALASVAGIGNPLLVGTSLQNGAFQYTVKVDITAASLGGRFTSPSPSPSPTGGK